MPENDKKDQKPQPGGENKTPGPVYAVRSRLRKGPGLEPGPLTLHLLAAPAGTGAPVCPPDLTRRKNRIIGTSTI